MVKTGAEDLFGVCVAFLMAMTLDRVMQCWRAEAYESFPRARKRREKISKRFLFPSPVFPLAMISDLRP